jgi:hypothetical protein
MKSIFYLRLRRPLLSSIQCGLVVGATIILSVLHPYALHVPTNIGTKGRRGSTVSLLIHQRDIIKTHARLRGSRLISDHWSGSFLNKFPLSLRLAISSAEISCCWRELNSIVQFACRLPAASHPDIARFKRTVSGTRSS